jgi:quercetin 2,3-dioxygenase
VRGEARVNGQPLKAGDAAKLTGESHLVIDQGRDAEVLFFDLSR